MKPKYATPVSSPIRTFDDIQSTQRKMLDIAGSNADGVLDAINRGDTVYARMLARDALDALNDYHRIESALTTVRAVCDKYPG